MTQISWRQRQQYKRRPAAGASGSFAEPTRLFASAASPSSSTLPQEGQEHPEHTTQFKHSLDRISILPPVPERDAGYKVEASNMQQIGAESSPTLSQERPERPECTTQFKHSLDRISILPPVPERATGYEVEPSGMQQIGAESSSGQREETGEQAESQKGEALQRVAAPSQAPQNRTGLPDTLKAGVENLSGLSLDDVRVHYHSAKPAQVDALAYTQGTEIHVGPGQEQHLAHEAWHVVQQKEGRVQPTVQTKGVAINDDHGLEKEADVMGMRASGMSVLAQPDVVPGQEEEHGKGQTQHTRQMKQVVQLMPATWQAPKVLAVSNAKQKTENVCWSAVGYCIHLYYGGARYRSRREFVEAMGNTGLVDAYDNDEVADIDEIIGSLSQDNHLNGYESGPFPLADIITEIDNGCPIIAHVNNEHYIVINGYRTDGSDYEFQIMDPDDGVCSWVTTEMNRSATKIKKIWSYQLTGLYYTKP